MIDANWLPVPGLIVTLAALLMLAVSWAAHRRPWAGRLQAVADCLAVGGAAAMIIGVVIGYSLGALH